jgi:hypothetical protein
MAFNSAFKGLMSQPETGDSLQQQLLRFRELPKGVLRAAYFTGYFSPYLHFLGLLCHVMNNFSI